MINQKQIQSDLENILDKKRVLTEKEGMLPWASDWTTSFIPQPLVVVFPESTEEVSSLLKYASQKKIAVVPSGGKTGLAGGAVATSGEMVLSLNRMSKILKIDTIAKTIEVEAGALTEKVQEEASKAGLYFPIDLASKGSSQIGGNIASNAGGLKFIRYGGMRESILGLEIVLANGDILDLNTDLYKNNTGYDLKQFFIGSEGTLGVVTKAHLKLTKKPGHLLVSYLGFENFESILGFLKFTNEQKFSLTAFEFFTDPALEKVKAVFPQIRTHYLEEDFPYYAIVEVEAERETDKNELEASWMKAFEGGLVGDVFIANSSEEFKGVWALRENITESLAASSHVRKNDITISVSKLGAFLEKANIATRDFSDKIEVIYFGHLGDGNIHINYIAPKESSKEIFEKEASKLEVLILKEVIDLKGSISAEHGVGLLKKEALKEALDPKEIEIMRKIKKVFDPLGIMNPGKIFDLV